MHVCLRLRGRLSFPTDTPVPRFGGTNSQRTSTTSPVAGPRACNKISLLYVCGNRLQCMANSPHADATILEWQEWASLQTGIKLNPNSSEQNPKLYEYIMKHRFPKYTDDLDMEDAIEHWVFYASLEGQLAHCVCTKFITNLNQVRHRHTGRGLVIGSECFKRYFTSRHVEYRTRRKKWLRQEGKQVNDMGARTLMFTGMTFEETVNTNHSVVAWAKEATCDLEAEWEELRGYANMKLFVESYGRRTFKSKNARFEVLAEKDKKLVWFCMHKYTAQTQRVTSTVSKCTWRRWRRCRKWVRAPSLLRVRRTRTWCVIMKI